MKRKELIEKTVQVAMFGAVFLNSGCGGSGGSSENENNSTITREEVIGISITDEEFNNFYDEYVSLYPEQNNMNINVRKFFNFVKKKKGV